MAARFFRAWLRRAGSVLAAIMLCGAAAVLPHASAAEMLDFEQALDVWLADDEATALPALARLAADGDQRALLLLGLIDKSAALQGPWLAQRSRAERIAVMRAPGGLSGQSWLNRIEGPDDISALAGLWRELLQVGTGLATAEALHRMGEPRAARQAVLTMAMREELAPGAGWPDWLDIELAWAVWPFAREELRADIARRVPPGHPQWTLMGGAPGGADQGAADGAADRADDGTRDAENLSNWLAEAPATRPLQALCAALCPESAPACRLAAHAALGSHGAVLTLGSPAEMLIPEALFLSSPRGRQAILRRMLLSTDMRGRAALLARAHATDACLGAHLAAAAESYRPGRGGASRTP